jgi:hypothetical protein
MDEPWVHLVVPFWGEPDLLFRTIDSVRAQTDGRWRLTVIDDHHPDESVGERLSRDPDPRIAYRRNPVNLGIVGNFRASLRAAEGPYFTMLGSDDLLEPGYVATVLELARRYPEADIIQPGVVVVDEHDRPVRPLTDRVKAALMPADGIHEGEELAAGLLRGAWYYWPSLAFKTATAQRHDFRDGFPIVLDLAFLVDLVLDGARMVADRRPVFRYRRHGSSASQTSILDGSRFAGDRRYLALAGELARQHGYRAAARAARTRWVSRLHGIAALPVVVRAGSRPGIASVLRQVFGVA